MMGLMGGMMGLMGIKSAVEMHAQKAEASNATDAEQPTPTELVDAPSEFYDLLAYLVADAFPYLAEARIRIQVRERAPVINEIDNWAETDTANNDAEKAEFDFTLWFALDRWNELNDYQREALMFHELCHCVWDDEGKPLLRPHDIGEFYDVLTRYGPWWPDAQEFMNIVRHMPGGKSMPASYQAPMPGNGGSRGGATFQRPMPGNGGSRGGATYQQPMPGNGGSRGGATFQLPMPGNGGSRGGATFQVAAPGNGGSRGGATYISDPTLGPDESPHVIDFGNGVILELSEESYAMLYDLFMGSAESPMLEGKHVYFPDDALINLGGGIKALGDGKIGGYLVRFTDAQHPDLENDFFSKRTNYGVQDGDPLSIYYNHGGDPILGKRQLGRGRVKFTDEGIWLEAQLALRDKYERSIYGMVEQNKLGWSSGSVSHLVEREAEKGAFHIKHWPIGEGSLTPIPAAGPILTAVMPLKAWLGQFAMSEATPEAARKTAADATSKKLLLELELMQLETGV